MLRRARIGGNVYPNLSSSLLAACVLLVLSLTACAKSVSVRVPASTVAPCVRGNAILESWHCRENTMYLGIVVSDKRAGFRVVSVRGDRPYEIIEPKRHLRGYVDYDGARITEARGLGDGHFIIPLVSSGRRFWLRWRVDGEWETYEGVARAPTI